MQRKLGELMEQVVSLLQLVDPRRKQIGIPVAIWKEFKACVDAILKTIPMSMIPSTCFECISKLLGNADSSVRKKVYGYSFHYILLCWCPMSYYLFLSIKIGYWDF